MVVRYLKSTSNRDNDPIKHHTVEVSFECDGIGELNSLNEHFQAELIIKSKWRADSDDITEYDPKTQWNPKLYIYNAISIKEEKVTYGVVQDDKNDEVYIVEERKVIGTFWEKFEFENFPLDTQKLSVVLSTKYGAQEISLVDNPHAMPWINFDAVRVFKEQQKWHLYRLATTEVEDQLPSDKKNDVLKRKASAFSMTGHLVEIVEKSKHVKPPTITVTFHTARRPEHILYNGFYLVFLVTLMCLPTFSIDQRIIDKRLICHLTILLTMVNLKWVMNRLLPDNPKSTILDKYIITSLVYNCLVMTWHSVSHIYLTNGYPPNPNTELGLTLDKWFCIIFAVIFLVIQFVFFLQLMYANEKRRALKRLEAKYTEDLRELFINEYKNSN